jgi:multisubunit Na+/H+ antiporter MnhG subunit
MEIVNRFLSFEKLMAGGLVKVVYWIGLVGIVLGTLFAFFNAFGLFRFDAGSAFVALIGAPIGGVLALVFWRVICELYLVLFRISDQLKEMNDALVKGPNTFS